MENLKIVVFGNGGVGKTSFLNKLINDEFDPNSKLTSGVDFFSTDYRDNGMVYKITLWDLGGQPEFRDIQGKFFDGMHAGIFVFDMEDYVYSIPDFKEWYKIILKNVQHINFPILILGSKHDCHNEDQIDSINFFLNDIIDNEIYSDINFGYVQISAKTGHNIDSILEILVDLLKH